MKKTRNRSYSELSKLKTFKERFDYLALSGFVGKDTFGYDRYLNQALYRSAEWKRIRNQVIVRDNGCDLGIKDRPIHGRVYIHHLNPIEKDDVLDRARFVLDPENLICVSFETHQAIHYSNYDSIDNELTVRTKNDTCPWRK